MAQFHPDWLEHQRKRWRRHDWQRYVRPDANAYSHMYGHHEQDTIARKDGTVQADMTPEEQEAYRSELLELKAIVAELQWQLALRRFARKYRPDQARDERGRFADEGGPTDISAAKRLPAALREFAKWTVRNTYLRNAGRK